MKNKISMICSLIALLCWSIMAYSNFMVGYNLIVFMFVMLGISDIVIILLFSRKSKLKNDNIIKYASIAVAIFTIIVVIVITSMNKKTNIQMDEIESLSYEQDE